MNKRYLLLPPVAVLLSACATIPNGPGVMVLPGTQKSYDEFRADDLACQQFAQGGVGPPSPGYAPTDSGTASAVAGTAIGAAAGALLGSVSGNAGSGAAIGAGTGLLFGGLAGTDTAGATSYQLQRRYDASYVQCMYAKGNQIPVRGGYRSLTSPSYSTYARRLPTTPPPPPGGSPLPPSTNYPQVPPPESGPITPGVYPAPTPPASRPAG